MKRDKKKHVIKFETKMTLAPEKREFDLDKRRAAIKAALLAATAGLAATTAGLAAQAAGRAADPWGEVIIEPIWYEKNPKVGDVLIEAASVTFWE